MPSRNDQAQEARSLTNIHFETTTAEAAGVRKVELCLYASHFFSTWGQRSHEFFIGLALLDLAGGSLVLVSTFGLVDGLGVALAAPSVGQWVGETERLRAACASYLFQNLGILLSAACVIAAFHVHMDTVMFSISVIGTVIVTSASSVGAMGATLSVEREWTKALHRFEPQALAELNAGMRRIDLSCLIVAPIVIGLMMTYVGKIWAAVAIMVWNLSAWLPEWLLLRHAKSRSPKLQEDMVSAVNKEAAFALLEAWRSYFRQPLWPAALALALLYLTVLSFGLLSTAYLYWRGLSEAELSVYRGLGAAAGVLATYAFPCLHRNLGLTRTGTSGILLQLSSLALAVLPCILGRFTPLAPPDVLVTHALVFGLIVSRFGLWLFDLCVSQLLQDDVLPEELGMVNGVQGSLSSLFQSASYLAGILCPDPRQYVWLMIGSMCAISSACILYLAWASSVGRLPPTGVSGEVIWDSGSESERS